MTGIIFNSVTAFVEQVGRRLQWKWAELDNMICIYVGPQASALQFKPKINSPHPQYPLMFVTDSSITNKEALVAEVSVTYAGIIQTSGASSYTTQPIISKSPVQGSRDSSSSFIAKVSDPVYEQIAGPGGVITGASGAVMTQPALYNYGSQTTTMRWVGEQCSVRYQTIPQPGGPKFSGLGRGNVTYQIVSETWGPVQVAGTNVQLVVAQAAVAAMNLPQVYWNFQTQYMGMTMEQKGRWYDCTETYAPVLL